MIRPALAEPAGLRRLWALHQRRMAFLTRIAAEAVTAGEVPAGVDPAALAYQTEAFGVCAVMQAPVLGPEVTFRHAREALLGHLRSLAIDPWRGVSFTGGRPTTPDAFNVVREYAITFHRPVRGTGEVVVHFWLDRLGTTSAGYRFRVASTDGGTVFAEGRRVNVRLDPATMRPAPWTDGAREIAATLLRSVETLPSGLPKTFS